MTTVTAKLSELRPQPVVLDCGCGVSFRYEPAADETRPTVPLAREAAVLAGWRACPATCPACVAKGR